MRRAVAKGRRKISVLDIVLTFWGVILVILFLLFVNAATKIPMDSLTLVTFMMATAIWITAMISFISTFQTRGMLGINQQMLEEMRRSRPKPLVVANIESAPSGHGHLIVVKNKGRETARDIKVRYCLGKMQESKPSGKRATILQPVESPWAEIEVMPLGPGETQKFESGLTGGMFTVSGRFTGGGMFGPFQYFKFEITYSDGVESYKETYRVDASEIEWG